MVLNLRVVWVICLNPIRELSPNHGATQKDPVLWASEQRLWHLFGQQGWRFVTNYTIWTWHLTATQIQAGLVSTAGCYRHGAVAFMEGLVGISDPLAQFSPTHAATAGDRQHSCRQLQWKRWGRHEGLTVLTQPLTCSLWITALGTFEFLWAVLKVLCWCDIHHKLCLSSHTHTNTSTLTDSAWFSL